MVLRLFWKDIHGNSYRLGDLYKDGEVFIFDIVENDKLKQAINAGCYGIGEFDLYCKRYESNRLFDFFKRRIPSKKHIDIEEILEEFNMKEYDEMELLKKTNGILNTDRYYLEVV